MNFTKLILSTICTILLLLLPFILFVHLNSMNSNSAKGYPDEVNSDPTIQVVKHIVWFRDPSSPQYVTITRLAQLSLVFSFGAIGTLISLLTREKNSFEMASRLSLTHLIVAECVGATFALVLMIFFWGELISGKLFPRISFSSYMTIYVHEELAKLLVWSFIAGFSERLVPQFINNIIEKSRIKYNTDTE